MNRKIVLQCSATWKDYYVASKHCCFFIHGCIRWYFVVRSGEGNEVNIVSDSDCENMCMCCISIILWYLLLPATGRVVIQHHRTEGGEGNCFTSTFPIFLFLSLYKTRMNNHEHLSFIYWRLTCYRHTKHIGLCLLTSL